jgi:hypothetical protein
VIDRWVGRNVDLDRLTQQIQKFFEDRNFDTKLKQKPEGVEIRASPKKGLGAELNITVAISGHPNDFTVKFLPAKKTRGFFSPLSVVGYLTSFLGGGSLLLRDVKLQEALRKLEDAFWKHVDMQIDQLTNSALKASEEEK